MDNRLEQDSATKTYGDYVAEQIKRQDERKSSIQASGLAVITTSGALATLLLALAAASKKNQTSTGTFVLPDASQSLLKWAVIAFGLAALGAVLTNFPVWLQWADPDGLKRVLSNEEKTAADAEWDVAENRLAILASLQKWNDRKGIVLFLAMVAELVAIVLIGLAVWKAL
jgi:hypothetical protein